MRDVLLAKNNPLLFLALITLLLSCNGQTDQQTLEGVVKAPQQESNESHQSLDPQTVAVVNGTPIGVDLVVSQMASDHQSSVKSVLDDAIELFVLSQEATRRGLDSHPEVLLVQKQTAIKRYLENEFEKEFTPQSVPNSKLKAAFNLNHQMFNNPELVRASHILVKVDETEKGGLKEPDAMELIDQIHKATLSNKIDDAAAFRALADEFKEWGEVLAEDLGLFSRRARFVQEFKDQAFQLQHDGEISHPFLTQFGYHIIYRESFKPELNQSLDQVIDVVRDKVFPELQREEFENLLTRLGKVHVQELNPQLLKDPLPVPSRKSKHSVDLNGL